jgi:hypothetical protein
MNESTVTKRNGEARLTHGEFYQVCELLKQTADKNAKIQMTQVELADLTSECLGFHVSTFSIKQAARVSGITTEMKKKAKRKPSRRVTLKDFKELSGEVESLKATTFRLRDMVDQMARYLNIGQGQK